MKDVLLFSGLIPLVALCVIIILFTAISTALNQTSLFNKKTSVVVTLCISLLSIIGLFRFFGSTDKTVDIIDISDSSGTFLDVILLPYTALAVAILLLLLLLFISKIFQSNKLKRNFNQIEDQSTKSKLTKKQNEKRLIK